MHNDVLNQLKSRILAVAQREPSSIEAAVNSHLDQALRFVHANDYVEDCLFQISEALAALSRDAAKAEDVVTYLLGAIEALRDELNLCDVDMDIRQAAVGF